MPSPTNRAAGQTITATDINGLAVVANGAETTANNASTAANNAQTKANAAYVKPATGIPVADIAATGVRDATTFLRADGSFVVPPAGLDWTVVATKTAAYTAATGEAVPVDTTAAFTLTLPAAAVGNRIRVMNVLQTGANVLTVSSASRILGESPCTVPPSGSIDFYCPVAGVWARF